MATETGVLNERRLQPGDSLGDYRIERLLGRGGMGAVYEATHKTDGRVVALKLLSVDLDQLDARERFLREGRTAAAINHPNVVYIYGTEELSGTPIITMELVSGGTLEEKVRRDGPMGIQDAVEAILQVIDGLDAALAVGVLHRDIKPSNCFVNADGSIKVGDFGLSKPVESIEQHKLTQTGLFLGTPVYSSPEQLLGETLDARSDIYAVGVTFYYLLTGRLPYESGSLMQVMAAVLNGTPAPMDSERIPPEVQQVVLKALARHAKDRYQNYKEFRAAVAALRTQEFRPATLFERFIAWMVDTIPLSYIVSSSVVAYWGLRGRPVDPSHLERETLFPFLTLFSLLLVVGIPEAVRGASLGKWLVGIRVLKMDGKRIGMLRSAARLVILNLTGFAMVVTFRSVPPEHANVVAVIVYCVGVLFPFITARPKNGWRMVQDVATGSRVVRPLSRERQRRGDVDAGPPPTLSGDEPTVGKYRVLGGVPQHPGVRTGWDSTIQRRVWLTPANAEDGTGIGEVAQQRRDISRLTRLRWTGAIRTAEGQWEVFEAPTGEPLHDRLVRPVSWKVERNWLTDLLREAQASERDGSWPSGASLDVLWVTGGDEILLSDVTTSDANGEAGMSSLKLLQAFAGLLLERAHGEPRPPHGTRLLQRVKTATSLGEIEAPLHDAMEKPVEVTPRRRIGPTLIVGVLIVVFGLLMNVVVGTQRVFDPTGYKADQLVQFHQSSRACSFEFQDGSRVRRCLPQTSRVNSGGFFRDVRTAFDRMWRGVGLPPLDPTIPGTEKTPEEVTAEKRLVEVYLATSLRERILDSTMQASVLTGGNAVVARSIVGAIGSVDSAEVGRANYLVDTLWNGQTVHDIGEVRLIIAMTTIAVFAMVLAICTVLLALVMRRGLLFRVFHLDLVRADGRPAARWQTTLRALLVWSVFLVPVLMVVILRTVPESIQPLVLGVVMLSGFGMWVYGIVTVVRNPSRSLVDRLTGTYVVIA